MNTITNEERQRIYAAAERLRQSNCTLNQATEQLMRQFGISKQRARHAAARAIRHQRYRDTKERV